MIRKEYHTINGVEMVTTTVVPEFSPEPAIAGPDEVILPPDETRDETTDAEA